MKKDKPREAVQIGERIVISLTDMGEGPVTARNHIKGKFIEKDKAQMYSYIKDLEHTLAINKEIITELLNKDSTERNNKKVIEKLNTENGNLQFQLKKVIRERNDYQARLLITEQIIEDNKARELEQARENEEKSIELIDQLNRKEFFLQNYERRYNKAINVLKKYSHKDQEIQQALKELNVDTKGDRKIANVVEENERLQNEIEEQRNKIQSLEAKIVEITETNVRLESLLEDYKTQESSHFNCKLRGYRGQPVKGTTNTNTEETTDKDRIWQLEEEMEKTQAKTQDLYKLNIRLSEALETANAKLSYFKKLMDPRGKGQNRSSLVTKSANVHEYAGGRASSREFVTETAKDVCKYAAKSARIYLTSEQVPGPILCTNVSPKFKNTEPNEKEKTPEEEKNKVSFGEADEPNKSFGEMSSIKNEAENGSIRVENLNISKDGEIPDENVDKGVAQEKLGS